VNLRWLATLLHRTSRQPWPKAEICRGQISHRHATSKGGLALRNARRRCGDRNRRIFLGPRSGRAPLQECGPGNDEQRTVEARERGAECLDDRRSASQFLTNLEKSWLKAMFMTPAATAQLLRLSDSQANGDADGVIARKAVATSGRARPRTSCGVQFRWPN
jgi:hypothetical protein